MPCSAREDPLEQITDPAIHLHLRKAWRLDWNLEKLIQKGSQGSAALVHRCFGRRPYLVAPGSPVGFRLQHLLVLPEVACERQLRRLRLLLGWPLQVDASENHFWYGSWSECCFYRFLVNEDDRVRPRSEVLELMTSYQDYRSKKVHTLEFFAPDPLPVKVGSFSSFPSLSLPCAMPSSST